MIFVMVGTEKFPFDRLASAIDELQKSDELQEEFFIQLGSCNYLPKHARFERFLSFGDVCKNIEKSSVVISHAGVGSTLVCLQLGKSPILVPRRAQLNEHVDDHQAPFAERLGKTGLVTLVDDVGKLAEAIRSVSGKVVPKDALAGSGELTGWLQSFWHSL